MAQVLVHADEVARMHAWARDYQHIETGGDLFGLWRHDGTPVVHLAIGPGQQSRRTPVSFHQDTDYLEFAGNFLRDRHGLCVDSLGRRSPCR